MELDWQFTRGRWAYWLMWVLSVGLFTAVVWAPALIGWIAQRGGGWVPSQVQDGLRLWDQWFTRPQVRMIYFLAPPLEGRWPILGAPMGVHRLILGIAYGLSGWLWAKLLFYLYDWWSARLAWLLVFWLVCLSGVEAVILIFLHLGALANA